MTDKEFESDPFEEFKKRHAWAGNLERYLVKKMEEDAEENPRAVVSNRLRLQALKERFPKAESNPEDYPWTAAAMVVMGNMFATDERVVPTEAMFDGQDQYKWQDLAGFTDHTKVVSHVLGTMANIQEPRQA